MLQRCKIILVFALCCFILAGCGKSSDPLNYLPEAPVYVSINNDKIRASEGFQKLEAAMKSLNPQTAEAFDDNVSKVYIALDSGTGPGGTPKGTGVMMGKANFGDKFTDDLKTNGFAAAKKGDYDIYTSGPLGFAKLNDDSIAIFSDQAGFDKMAATAEKKNAAAKNTAHFQRTKELANVHGIVIHADAKNLMSGFGQNLSGLMAQNPQAGEALQKLETVTVLIDWDKMAVFQIKGLLPDDASAQALAATANTYLNMGKAYMLMNPQLSAVGQGLSANAAGKEVVIKLEVPQEIAEKWLNDAAATAPAMLPTM